MIKDGERHNFEDRKKYINDIRVYIIKYLSIRADLRCICLRALFYWDSIRYRWDKRGRTGVVVVTRHDGKDERIVTNDLRV